ncbi:MAG: hypothetical protein M1296_05540 [Chloroflexi bacterium]|nr:hypothetical protein [Chloroflexota bacterium]
MALFDQRVFLLPDQPHPTLGYLPQQYLFAAIEALLGPIGAPTIPTPVTQEFIPAGETAISPQTPVEGKDGRLGRVEEIEVDADGTVQRLVVRHGSVFGEQLTDVPSRVVQSVSPERIKLSLSRDEFESLAQHSGRDAR